MPFTFVSLTAVKTPCHQKADYSVNALVTLL